MHYVAELNPSELDKSCYTLDKEKTTEIRR